VNKRFVIAVAVGGLIGGGVVAGFGPYVRSKVQQKADRYGADVSIARVVPTLAGVRMRGVQVSLRSTKAIKLRFDDVVVGWFDQRPVSTSGGVISAVGSPRQLRADLEKWQRLHLAQSSASKSPATGRTFGFDGFSVEWKHDVSPNAHHATASGVSVARRDGRLVLEMEKLSGKLAGSEVEVRDGRLVLIRASAGYQLQTLASKALNLKYSLGSLGVVQAHKTGQKGSAPASASVAPTSKAASLKKKAPAGRGSKKKAKSTATPPAKPVVHERVRAARWLHATLLELARQLDGKLAADAHVAVEGTRAQIGIGKEVLNLGPGVFGLRRHEGNLVVELSPDLVSARANKNKTGGSNAPLTFTLQIPLDKGGATNGKNQHDVVAQLRGGPVWLSTLGVREGDLGLKDVSRTSLESDAQVVLPANGEVVKIKGHGKLRELSIFNPHLAPETLRGVVLAWRANAEARLDGSLLRLRDTELDLGDLRVMLNGGFERHSKGYAVDLKVQVPLVTCERAFASIPQALVPKLAGMGFAGSLAAKGHARFDTAKLVKSYDVDWVGTMSCRVVQAPPTLRPERFKRGFQKVVYTPEGTTRTMGFGPNTIGWASRNTISRFMIGAVLTTEDGRFYRHTGFDKEAIVNSIRENLVAGRFVRGASTISMQLAKNLYLPRAKTLSRKLQEAVLTMYLEQVLTKPEMMELYLNVIEYGPMVYGIRAAARHYFRTSPANLSLGQALYLASILRNPKKQYFGAGGAVPPGRMGYLRRLMKIVHKIGRISDDDLDVGLRETVVFGGPSHMAEPESEDPYDDLDDPQATGRHAAAPSNGFSG